MSLENLTPGEAQRLAAFNELIAKFKAVGWVEKSSDGLGGECKDVRFTGAGTGGLLNVNALEKALGGLTGSQAEMLFFVARKLANDKPDTN